MGLITNTKHFNESFVWFGIYDQEALPVKKNCANPGFPPDVLVDLVWFSSLLNQHYLGRFGLF
jgi:hypothetical protein